MRFLTKITALSNDVCNFVASITFFELVVTQTVIKLLKIVIGTIGLLFESLFFNRYHISALSNYKNYSSSHSTDLVAFAVGSCSYVWDSFPQIVELKQSYKFQRKKSY